MKKNNTIVDNMKKDKKILCTHINNEIVNLSQEEIQEIFKILHKANINYTKNNNGVFINLLWLDLEQLHQIHDYINFCLKSQKDIKNHEKLKETFLEHSNIDDGFGNIIESLNIAEVQDDNPKEKSTSNYDETAATETTREKNSNSNMRFFHLRKKLMKPNPTNNTYYDNVLFVDE